MNMGFGSNRTPQPQVRLTRPMDVNTLTMLDLKCYHYPMSLAEWQAFLKTVTDTNRVVVLEVGRDPVGFAAWELIEDAEAGTSYVNVTRVGVHPAERRKGYGSALLQSIEGGAMKLRADGISIVVPEIHCCPGDPDDVSAFLATNGFKPSGAIEYNFKRMYGDMIDGYYFVKRAL